MKQPEEIKLEFTREWIRRAENDYRTARHLLESGEDYAYGVTFHAQQTAIAASNRPEKIDPAILRTGRIDHVVYVGPPDFDARVELFKLYLENRPIEKDIDCNRLTVLEAFKESRSFL